MPPKNTVLSLDITFLLPDGFSGGLTDALRAYADYRDRQGYGPGYDVKGDEEPLDEKLLELSEKRFYDLCDAYKTQGYRVLGAAALVKYELDEQNNEWKTEKII